MTRSRGVAVAAACTLLACGGRPAQGPSANGDETAPPPESSATARAACDHAWTIMKREAPKDMTDKSDEEAMTQCLEKLQDEAADGQRLHCEINCVMAAEHLRDIDRCVKRFCAPSTGSELH